MEVTSYKPYIEKLLTAEPWRSQGEGTDLCEGELDWDGSPHWLCKECGRIGVASYTAHHRAIPPPITIRDFILEALCRWGQSLISQK